MDLDKTGLYCLRAACFAFPSAMVFSLLRMLILRRKGLPVRWDREVILFSFALYLAALLHITIWREGPDWAAVFSSGPKPRPLLQPMLTTLDAWKQGILRFLYNVVGNIIWFLPLGAMFRASKHRFSLLQAMGLGLALSFFIEFFQWVLQTGVTDIDDLIFNSLGTGLGFLLTSVAFIARRTESD